MAEEKVKTSLNVSMTNEAKKATALTFDDIKVGDELPAHTRWITTKSALRFGKTYEDVFSGHINQAVAEKQFGARVMPVQGAVMEQGVTPLIVNWLRSVKPWLYGGKQETRFIQVVLPGDTMIYHGKVIEKVADADKKYVVVDVFAENQKGEKVLVATATIKF